MVINRRALVVLTGALLAGVIAVVLAMQWANRKISEGLTQVAVAGRNIDAGERLSAENMRLASWPRASLVTGSAESTEALNGRVTAQAITAGEPIIEQRLAASGVRPGLSAIISPGRRAMTVKVNEVIGVAGFALPGSFVDILVTLNHNGDPPISRIVLERIPVLAVAQEHTVKDETKPKVVNAVTLEVTPEQAERLDLARSVGTLSMVLIRSLSHRAAHSLQTSFEPRSVKGASGLLRLGLTRAWGVLKLFGAFSALRLTRVRSGDGNANY
jgi:pilus assembly protein CpaB